MEIQTSAPQIGFTLKSTPELNSVTYVDDTGIAKTGADMVGDFVLVAHTTDSNDNYLNADNTYAQTSGAGIGQHFISITSDGKLAVYNAYDRVDMGSQTFSFQGAPTRFVIADDYTNPSVSVLSDQSNWLPLIGTRTHSDTWRGSSNFGVAISANSTPDTATAVANYPHWVRGNSNDPDRDIATDTVVPSGGIERYQERYNMYKVVDNFSPSGFSYMGDGGDENYDSYIEFSYDDKLTINLVEDVDGQLVTTNVQNDNWVIKVRSSSPSSDASDLNMYVRSIDVFQRYSEYTQDRNTLQLSSVGDDYNGSLNFTDPFKFQSDGSGVLAQNPSTDNAVMLLTQGAWYGFNSDDLTTDLNNNIIGDPSDALFKATNSSSVTDPASDQISFKNASRSDHASYTKITEYESIEVLGMSDASNDGTYTKTSLTQFDKSGTDASVRYIDNRWVLTDSSGSIIQEVSSNADVTNAVSNITTDAVEANSAPTIGKSYYTGYSNLVFTKDAGTDNVIAVSFDKDGQTLTYDRYPSANGFYNDWQPHGLFLDQSNYGRGTNAVTGGHADTLIFIGNLQGLTAIHQSILGAPQGEQNKVVEFVTITDVDADGDGIPESIDPDDNNPDITGVDIDFDGIDDAVDTNPFDGTISGVDADNDGIDDAVDSDPSDPTISGADADGDGVDDAVDSDPSDPTTSGADADGDGIDDAVDSDPSDPTTSGVDADGDGIDDAVTATNILGKIGQKVGTELKDLKTAVSGDILAADSSLNARIDDVVSIFGEQIGSINLNTITGGLNVIKSDGSGVHPISLGISTDGKVSIGGTLKVVQKLTALGEIAAQRASIGESATVGSTLSVTGHTDLATVSLGGHLDAQSATFLGKLSAAELEVSGSTKIVNTTTVEVSDNILELNKSSDSSTTATVSGLEINRGGSQDKAKFLWDNSGDQQLFKFMVGDAMADLSAKKLSVPNGSGIQINNVALGDYADFWNALSTAKQ
jgi:hypothetical protein